MFTKFLKFLFFTVLVVSINLVAAKNLIKKELNQGRLKSETKTDWQASLRHQQEVWLYALEWCESRGIKEAINPQDRDGTPSWYSFQFKPDTFKHYGIKYGLLAKEITMAEVMEKIKDYDLQREIVRRMIDDKDVRWDQEFPVCILKKVGYPPRPLDK